MYPLNNYTTTDLYADAGEVVFSPPQSSCTMLVTGNSIYYQLAPADGSHAIGSTYRPEVFCPPGRYFFEPSDFAPSGRIGLLRVRSAVMMASAQVTVS